MSILPAKHLKINSKITNGMTSSFFSSALLHWVQVTERPVFAILN